MLLPNLSEQDANMIVRAYTLSEIAHRRQKRLSGEPYFEHVKAIALILIDECHITDASIISAAFLHDVVEDTKAFGKQVKIPYTVWIEEVRSNIAQQFNPKVANSVVALTEPGVDKVEIIDKKQAKLIKHNLLFHAPAQTLLVKMADRLHNLRTFYPKAGIDPKEQKEKKIKETKEILIPIFRKVLKTYPVEGAYLLNEIDKAIAVISNSTFLSPNGLNGGM